MPMPPKAQPTLFHLAVLADSASEQALGRWSVGGSGRKKRQIKSNTQTKNTTKQRRNKRRMFTNLAASWVCEIWIKWEVALFTIWNPKQKSSCSKQVNKGNAKMQVRKHLVGKRGIDQKYRKPVLALELTKKLIKKKILYTEQNPNKWTKQSGAHVLRKLNCLDSWGSPIIQLLKF